MSGSELDDLPTTQHEIKYLVHDVVVREISETDWAFELMRFLVRKQEQNEEA